LVCSSRRYLETLRKGQLKVDVSGQVAGVVAVAVAVGLDIQVNVQGVLVTGAERQE
jgi:hypothetical protein